MKVIPDGVLAKSTKFGGSYASLQSPSPSVGSVFILASGKTKASSSRLECDQDYSDFKLTLKALSDSLAKTKVDFLVYISSGGSVYGSGPEVKLETSALTPSTPYAVQKVNQEMDVLDFASSQGVKLLILRLANAFSASSSTRKGIVDSLLSIEPGDVPLTIYVNPDSRKQYGLFSDYAQAILLAISEFLLDNSPTKIVNLFSSNVYSVRQIIELVSKAKNIRVQDICTIQESNFDLAVDSVILGSIHPQDTSRFRWKSIEETIIL
jgi:nucleoside-diphosphate-sugar epimerase